MRTRRIAVLALVLRAGVLRAQNEADPRTVMPERPTVATHAHTVAPGILEIESGFERDRLADGSAAVGIPTNVKFGLTRHTQLNIILPLTGGGLASLGAGDIAVGVKWRVLDRRPVVGDFALLPLVTFPTGGAGRGSGTTGLTLTAISSHSLGDLDLDLNVAWTVRSGDGSRSPRNAWLWTASFGGPVAGPVGWVLEWFGYPATSGPAGSPAWSSVLFGPTLNVARTLTLDAGSIVPLGGPLSWAVYAGATWNLGYVFGRGARTLAGPRSPPARSTY